MGAKGSKKNTPPKPAKLSSKDKKFLMKQTGSSEEEVQAIFTQFHEKNPDGVLTKEEFCRLYDQLRPEPAEVIDEIAQKIFRCFDADNNGNFALVFFSNGNFFKYHSTIGTITFNEFMLAYAMTCRGDPKMKLEYAFDLYDVDESGSLNKAELVGVIDAMLDMLGADASIDPKKLSESCFAQCDDNNDGKVTKDEFVKNCLEDVALRSVMSPFN